MGLLSKLLGLPWRRARRLEPEPLPVAVPPEVCTRLGLVVGRLYRVRYRRSNLELLGRFDGWAPRLCPYAVDVGEWEARFRKAIILPTGEVTETYRLGIAPWQASFTPRDSPEAATATLPVFARRSRSRRWTPNMPRTPGEPPNPGFGA